jgi:hypothetical protein
MGCLPERALRSVPARRVARVIGTVVNVEGIPKKFVLATKSGEPFAYDMDQLTNRVTLLSGDAECNTVDGEAMPDYNAFKIDMGLHEESFRSSDQLQTFHLGCVRQDSSDSSEDGPSNPWLASKWWGLVPRTMVTLVFEDGSEGHYAQNESRPDSDDSDDSDDNREQEEAEEEAEEEEEEEADEEEGVSDIDSDGASATVD